MLDTTVPFTWGLQKVLRLNNVADVKRLVEADRRISISCITHELNISTGTVSRILNDFLGLSRISARWVPHCPTDAKRNNRKFKV